jgi:hypothetical protein
MPWYELTSDVMVRGTPRASGEVLDLSESEGQLLSGLGRAKPAQPPTKPEAAKPEAVQQEVSAKEAPAEAASAELLTAELLTAELLTPEPLTAEPPRLTKQAARRRAPSPSPKD